MKMKLKIDEIIDYTERRSEFLQFAIRTVDLTYSEAINKSIFYSSCGFSSHRLVIARFL